MARLPVHTVETAPEAAKPRVEAVLKANGFIPNLIGVLANAPEALAFYQEVGKLNAANSLTPGEVEVVQIIAAKTNECGFCVAGHTKIATLKKLLSEKAIQASRHLNPAEFDDAKLAALAAFTQAVIVPMNYKKSEAVREAADKIYAELTAAGVDVLLDDRDERAGVLLADSELLGIPHRIAIGDRGLKEGKVEYTERRSGETELVAAGEIAAKLKGLLA